MVLYSSDLVRYSSRVPPVTTGAWLFTTEASLSTTQAWSQLQFKLLFLITKPGPLQLKSSILNLKVGSLQLKPGSLQPKRGSL